MFAKLQDWITRSSIAANPEVSHRASVRAGHAAGYGSSAPNLEKRLAIDTRVIDELQGMLIPSASSRRLAWHGLGQDRLWICRPPQIIQQSTDATGLGFEIHVAQS
jgi:hypothetical protein